MVDTKSFLAKAQMLMAYDPQTGLFHRRLSSGKLKTTPAGTASNGYVHMMVSGQRCYAHRLAWLFVYGEWPKGNLDHINCNKSDNRIENLRECSGSINAQNRRSAYITNKCCGLLGVSRNGKRWGARIGLNGRLHHLGTFATAQEAHNAYIDAKRSIHAGCTL